MKDYAVLLDIGTTNIQALLLESGGKKELGYVSIPNSLSRYGKDVITRFANSLTGRPASGEIKRSILKDVNRVIRGFIRKNNLKDLEISAIAACGNTAMHHAALGLPFDTLLRSPFKPAHKRILFTENARKFGIDIKNTKAHFTFLPNIDGFVGSDALCVIMATGMHKRKALRLAIDMGTNGEIIMGNSSKILVASASAGPAFEVKYLYGTEMIDAVAALLKNGILDKAGFLKRKASVSQEDIRKLQLAKAAISGGIKVLKERFPRRNIREVFITGLFGTRLNISSAKLIGIFPRGAGRITVVDRAPLKGLKEVFGASDSERCFSGILKKIQHVELHREKAFFPSFTQSLLF